MKTLIRNIGKLVGIVPEGTFRKEGEEMGKVGYLDNAWLLIDGKKIDSFGQEGDSRYGTAQEAARIIDAAGGYVMPSFCDSHSHIVYAGSRYGEFRDKIDGLTYEQIAARGGGILNSADLLHETSEEELFRQSLERAVEVMNMGTGALEIKSGYGLNTEDELKMLRVIRRLRASLPMEIRATFLGAHAVGRAYTGRQGEYVDMVCREMLPAVAAEGLADFVDVFCDSGFFTPEETLQILDAAQAYGLRGKIHANELAVSGGVQAGVSRGALSVDHLERTTDAETDILKGTATMPTMLPGASFFSNLPYGRAKDYIRAGLGVALASDYNPGFRHGIGLHKDETHSGRSIQRLHAQRSIRDGDKPPDRLRHSRKTRRPHYYQAAPGSCVHTLQPPHSVHQQNHTERKGTIGIPLSSTTDSCAGRSNGSTESSPLKAR